LNFSYHKKKGHKATAEYWWNVWYNMAPKRGCGKGALWTTDTFEMWYHREGNDKDFRAKYV